MEITNEVKQRIVAAIAADRENYPSDNRHATALGIAPTFTMPSSGAIMKTGQ